MLICAGFLAGYMESHKLSVRVEKLEAFLQFLSAAKAEIRYSSIPVWSVVEKHGKNLSFLGLCYEKSSQGRGWREAWESSVREEAKSEGFSKSDLDLLSGFGEGFGTSDTEGQLAHFSLYAGLTTDALKSAKQDQSRKSKLYLMLGSFSGILAALLLC